MIHGLICSSAAKGNSAIDQRHDGQETGKYQLDRVGDQRNDDKRQGRRRLKGTTSGANRPTSH